MAVQSLFFAVGAIVVATLLYNHTHRFYSNDGVLQDGRNMLTDERENDCFDTPPNETDRVFDTNMIRRTDEAEADRIIHLPGSCDCCKKKFEQFSGYLDVTTTRHVFYWYVESQTGASENDPVVLWTNGGPGCSGLAAFGYEHGPYIFRRGGGGGKDDFGSKTPEDVTLDMNPYSWNQVANMLYIEQPAGVGFSYTDRDEDTKTNDQQAAEDNYRLILEFFNRFPERRSNDFFISSESYGGHYMPQLALEILKQDTDYVINFKGFLVGNPYVDPYTNLITEIESGYFHSLLPKPLYEEWKELCVGAGTPKMFSEECSQITNKVERMVDKEGINPYALDYPICLADGGVGSEHTIMTVKQGVQGNQHAFGGRLSVQGRALKFHESARTIEPPLLSSSPPFLPDEDRYIPCALLDARDYLNRLDVQTAIHVRQEAGGPVAYKWSVCGGVDYSQKDVQTPTFPLYVGLVKQAVSGNSSLNMMVYSGDDDSICSTAGTQAWIWNLGVNATDEVWEPWKVHGQTAGFVTKFDLTGRGFNMDDNGAKLSFVTVHGAGHEVPAYRPMEALELFRAYIGGK